MKENAKKVFVGIIVLAGIAVVFACAVKLIQAQRDKAMVQSSEISGVNAPKENAITIEAKTNVPTTVTLDDGSKVQITEENWRNYWDETRVNAVKDTNGVIVPVPKGYSSSKIYKKVNDENVYIERTVDTGFVIYEDTADQSGEPDGEIQYTYPGTEAQGAVIIWATDASSTVNSLVLKTAQTTRNQYVWVPVYNVDDMYGVDSTGKKWGKTYNMYNNSEPTLYGSVNNGIYQKDNDYREPDVVTSYDNDKTLPTYITEEERNEINKELTSNYEKTIASIKKYGGFYIGRYETGNLGQGTAKVVKSNSDIHTKRWYTMYRKCKELKGNNENVITSMIYGSQWDRTLMWIMETGKTYNDIAKDSTSWGNYSTASFYYFNGTSYSMKSTSSLRLSTGCAEYTNANNIYDLSGNVWDWTLEANGTVVRRYRGGYYNVYGSSYPAGYRNAYNPGYSRNVIGCRAALYVDL